MNTNTPVFGQGRRDAASLGPGERIMKMQLIVRITGLEGMAGGPMKDRHEERAAIIIAWCYQQSHCYSFNNNEQALTTNGKAKHIYH